MKKLSLYAVIAVVVFLVSGCGVAHRAHSPAVIDDARFQAVDSVVNAAVAAGSIPGAVVSVVKDGETVYLKAFGNKSVLPDTVAMTTDVVFDLASCSKCVGTTLSFMQLIENGKVGLHDPVDKYIPGFRPWLPEGGKGTPVKITVEHLLTHSSGIDSYLNVAKFVEKHGENVPDSLVSYIARTAGRNFRPGTKFLYSCLNFVTLQAILERVTGERLCDYAQKNVFGPLGLKHTAYLCVGSEVAGNEEMLALCAPTQVQADGKPLCGVVHDPLARRLNGGNSGNAGVFSDAEDLARICTMIMNGGELDGVRILSPATVELMCTVPEDIDPGVGRVLGWDKRSSHSGPRGKIFDRESTVCHTGYTGPSIVIDMKNKVALIILTHRVHPNDNGGIGKLRSTLADIVAGVTVGQDGTPQVDGTKAAKQ